VAAHETTTGECNVSILLAYCSSFDRATLTWIIVELCRDTDLQDRLRTELLSTYPHVDPNIDDLTNTLPLLDAIVHETLRVHPPAPEVWRVVKQGFLRFI
jgi:cytochrome P450